MSRFGPGVKVSDVDAVRDNGEARGRRDIGHDRLIELRHDDAGDGAAHAPLVSLQHSPFRREERPLRQARLEAHAAADHEQLRRGRVVSTAGIGPMSARYCARLIVSRCTTSKGVAAICAPKRRPRRLGTKDRYRQRLPRQQAAAAQRAAAQLRTRGRRNVDDLDLGATRQERPPAPAQVPPEGGSPVCAAAPANGSRGRRQSGSADCSHAGKRLPWEDRERSVRTRGCAEIGQRTPLSKSCGRRRRSTYYMILWLLQRRLRRSRDSGCGDV